MMGGSLGTLRVEFVIDAIRRGTREFYTIGNESDEPAWVEPFDCSCGVEGIRTEPDNTKDNNLGALSECDENCPTVNIDGN
jgi:hypothetical protein